MIREGDHNYGDEEEEEEDDNEVQEFRLSP